MFDSLLAEWKSQPRVVRWMVALWCVLAIYPALWACLEFWGERDAVGREGDTWALVMLVPGILAWAALLLSVAWGHLKGYKMAWWVGLFYNSLFVVLIGAVAYNRRAEFAALPTTMLRSGRWGILVRVLLWGVGFALPVIGLWLLALSRAGRAAFGIGRRRM